MYYGRIKHRKIMEEMEITLKDINEINSFMQAIKTLVNNDVKSNNLQVKYSISEISDNISKCINSDNVAYLSPGLNVDICDTTSIVKDTDLNVDIHLQQMHAELSTNPSEKALNVDIILSAMSGVTIEEKLLQVFKYTGLIKIGGDVI